jgi:RNA polymerase sigma-70 factor, ECF subfamily
VEPFGALKRECDVEGVIEANRTDMRADFAAVFSASYPTLIHQLTMMTRSRSLAEDLVQEAFVKCWQRWSHVRTLSDPAAWVRIVAVRQLISYERRQRVWRRIAPRLANGRAVDEMPHVDTDLWDAIAALPVHQRAALVLHYVEDLALEDIARESGVSVGTVKSRLSRARASLSQTLGTREGTDAL